MPRTSECDLSRINHCEWNLECNHTNANRYTITIQPFHVELVVPPNFIFRRRNLLLRRLAIIQSFNMVANIPLTIKHIAGSEASNRAIIAIFDAFDFRQASPPRGVDLLATSVPCLVVIPRVVQQTWIGFRQTRRKMRELESSSGPKHTTQPSC